MKKGLFTAISVIILASCTKQKQEEIQKSEEKNPPISNLELFESEKGNGRVLLLSDKLTVYNKYGEKLSDKNGLYGLIFPLDSVSDIKVDIAKSGDKCNEFNFVKINSPKVSGWLYSAEVYGYGNDKRDTIFSTGGVDFKLYHAKYFGVGVSDDDGLTGCDTSTPVVLYNSKFKTEGYIPLKDNTGKYPGKYFALDESEGWYDKIKETAFENGKLKLIVYREYQEGSAYFTVLISLSDKGYSALVTEVNTDTGKYMDEE